ncbi:MAG: globin [Frankiaceae bacterium]|nr:globin [Frankiaceae bacterium]
MSIDADLVMESLYRVAEISDDPAPGVYSRLFARHPEIEQLFVLDPAGAARRNMVVVAVECLMDYIGGRASSKNLVVSERINHANLGVRAEVFDDFFIAIRDAFGDLLGAEWTAETQRAWTEAIASLTASRGFVPSAGS